MFNPKRVIPSLAAGALSLSGCANVTGDGGGGMGGTGGAGGTGGLQAEIQAFCMKLVGCDPLYFNYEYCVTNISALEPSLTAECREVVRSYFDCVDNAPCATFAIDCSSTELDLCIPSTAALTDPA